jgi:transcriptional regulator with XRE-family HTH domain
MAEAPREVGFGKRLRDRRMECHLNQSKLAVQMQVPQTYISRWESGHFEYMTLQRLRDLKRILTISLDELIGGDAPSRHEDIETDWHASPLPTRHVHASWSTSFSSRRV